MKSRGPKGLQLEVSPRLLVFRYCREYEFVMFQRPYLTLGPPGLPPWTSSVAWWEGGLTRLLRFAFNLSNSETLYSYSVYTEGELIGNY